jgi:hypothetical protein
MYRRQPRSIYGTRSKYSCVCEPVLHPIIGVSLLNTLLNSLKESIVKFFPPTQTKAPFTADMTVGSKLPARIVIRLIWIKDNPGVQFDKTNQTHLWQVRDLYESMRLDYTKDPLFAT